MAAEDEEEREDALALTIEEEAVPAAPRGDEAEGEFDGTGDRSGGRTAGEIILERPAPIIGEMEDGGWSVGEIVLERPGLIAGEAEYGEAGGRSGGRPAGETAEEREEAAGELWKDGPVWTVRGVRPEMDGALKAAAAMRTARAEEALRPPRDGDPAWAGWEWAARGGTTGTALDGAGRSGPGRAGLEQAGLKGLYRQTVRGLRPAAPALPPEQAGRTVRAQEPGSAASLAVDELDRAVRRDSRRYDGGMSIY